MLRGVVSGTYWSVVCRWGRSWDASWASGLGIRWIQVSSVKIGERGWGTGFVGKVIKVDIVEKKVFLFLKVVDSPLTLSCSLYSKSTVWYGSSISGKHLFLKLNVLSRTVILGKIRLWLEQKTKAIPVFSKSFWLCFLGTVMGWGFWVEQCHGLTYIKHYDWIICWEKKVLNGVKSEKTGDSLGAHSNNSGESRWWLEPTYSLTSG